jgi:branched-chain amino acid transport system substrate-binding protein
MNERPSNERAAVVDASATGGLRNVLRRGAFAVVAIVGLSALLAACGGSSDDETTAANGGDGGGANSAVVGELKNVLDTPTGEEAGEGTSVKVGALEPLTGGGAVFGEEGSKGFELAAEEIEAMGGPKFEFDIKDHKSGDAQAGIQATREWGLEGIAVSLTSYQGDLGATFPNLEQYKIFTLDPSGGSSAANEGQPFFYGTRANQETASVAGRVKYLREAYPDAKTVYYSAADLGPEINKAAEAAFDEAAAKYGFETVGKTTTKAGSTDFSDLVGRVQSAKPDVHFTNIYSPDIAYMIKQSKAAGLNVPVLGYDYVPEDSKIAGAASSAYQFGVDFFGPTTPGNAWTDIFRKEFEKKYNSQPTQYAANNYESTFALWQLLRQIIGEGGDPGNGEDWVKALEANPSFPSVYGGEGDTPGVLEIDTKTHLVSKRAMGVYQAPTSESQPPKLLATFNLEAAEFKLVK